MGLLATAFAPAMASSSSCCALAAPLTPTPPMTRPSNSIGTPPCKGVKSGSAIIGGVGVSGAASAQQDEELALAGAAAFRSAGDKAPDKNASAVSFFESGTVRAAFDKGAVLVGDDSGHNYMVHASRREKAGMAEVHTLDTDIIYVLEGEADFVTGGRLVEGKEVAPNEVRGSGIEGGDARTLKRGDVITVAGGTPHWFREVRGPFLYYVVKVR